MFERIHVWENFIVKYESNKAKICLDASIENKSTLQAHKTVDTRAIPFIFVIYFLKQYVIFATSIF